MYLLLSQITGTIEEWIGGSLRLGTVYSYQYKGGVEGMVGLITAFIILLCIVVLVVCVGMVIWSTIRIITAGEDQKKRESGIKWIRQTFIALIAFFLLFGGINFLSFMINGQTIFNICGLYDFFANRIDSNGNIIENKGACD